jgi:hypothetical protein
MTRPRKPKRPVGRPPKPAGTTRVRVYLRLAPETVEKLDRIAESWGYETRTAAVEHCVDIVWLQRAGPASTRTESDHAFMARLAELPAVGCGHGNRILFQLRGQDLDLFGAWFGESRNSTES